VTNINTAKTLTNTKMTYFENINLQLAVSATFAFNIDLVYSTKKKRFNVVLKILSN